MRLLQLDGDGNLSLTADLRDNIPPYAILSHTWGADNEEVVFEDIGNSTYKTKEAAYRKLCFCGEQARKDKLEYFWADTCCIKKTDSSELSEAITSMYRWYSRAQKCYVYLSDVSASKRDSSGSTQRSWEDAFRSCKWFTRGWTLQELLAPSSVEFFSREGQSLGDKHLLGALIHHITKIPLSALRDTDLSTFSYQERMQWTANRTTKRAEDRAYCLQGIFGVFIPPMYGEEGNAFYRLKDEIDKRARRQLDDVGEAFATSISDQVRIDSSVIHNTQQITSAAEHQRYLLNSLRFGQMDSRRATIKNAYSTTCGWFLEHEIYTGWIDPDKFSEHRGLLWIRGKPGAGKSTLIKFAHARADREAVAGEILISFFFNARGDELEKSAIGMYRALMFQLMNQAEDLQLAFNGVYAAPDYHDQEFPWTIELLRQLWMAVVPKLGQRRLKCFIDALDECDEQEVRDFVEFFEELGKVALDNGNRLYVCFASRHYPTIEIRNGWQLILEKEQGHGEDLAKYVQNHLRAGDGDFVEDIRLQIQRKSNGVFMWAVLVVEILNAEFRNGRIFAVQKRLHEIPEKLSDLFADMLKRDGTNIDDLLLCLQWILFARRPLKLEEFYFAMVAGLDPELEHMNEWNPALITAESMSRFMLSSSKGLAELTKSEEPTVQFIHESVRDYLIKDGGMAKLWPDLSIHLPSLSHDKLKQCCRTYLLVDLSNYVKSDRAEPKASSPSAKGLRRKLIVKFPFLEYASHEVFYHADEAARDISQEEFLQDFALKHWLHVSNLLEAYQVRRHTPDASLLYVLAEKNCTRLIEAGIRNGLEVNVRGERHSYPIFAALANGHRDAARALLQSYTTSCVEDMTAHLQLGPAFWARKDQTPFLWALEQGHKALAELLVRFVGVDLESLTTRNGRKVLSLAAARGYEGVIRQCLSTQNADVNQFDDFRRTPISYAAERGHTATVRLLLHSGARVDDEDCKGETPLIKAVRGGHEAIVQLLLDGHAKLTATDKQGDSALIIASRNDDRGIIGLLLGRNAPVQVSKSREDEPDLIAAVRRGREVLVRGLLDGGAAVDTKDQYGNTALTAASQHSHRAIVQFLLDKGAAIDAANSYGDTALIRAAACGREAVALLLLQRGASVNVVNKYGNTALICAAEIGHEAITLFLLNSGSDINAAAHSGSTALIRAARFSCESVVRLLLHRGAHVNATDNDSNTALICAVWPNWQTPNRIPVLSLLLDKGAEVNAKNRHGDTALMLGAKSGYIESVGLLIDRGAQVNIANKSGDTPLMLGAEQGYIEAVRLLLDGGALVNWISPSRKTALVAAARKGHNKIVRLLLNRGAEVGSEVLSFAEIRSNPSMLKVLRSNGNCS